MEIKIASGTFETPLVWSSLVQDGTHLRTVHLSPDSKLAFIIKAAGCGLHRKTHMRS